MGITSEVIRGHNILALERFKDDTRHMVIFDVLTVKSPWGQPDDRLRMFLNDRDYTKAQAAHNKKEIKILRHASVIEGHIVPDKKKKGRRHR